MAAFEELKEKMDCLDCLISDEFETLTNYEKKPFALDEDEEREIMSYKEHIQKCDDCRYLSNSFSRAEMLADKTSARITSSM